MNKYLIIVIIAAVVVSFFGLESVTLFDVDEAVFAEATKEMVESDNWLTPTYNGENRYDKPILFYWAMAVSYELFEINEFAARLPSAISGILLSLAMFLFLRQFYDDKKAFYASISFILSVYFLVYSHAAVTDMLLTLFITLSLFSFYFSLKKDRTYIYGFYIFSALAFLTKGLIGIIFPFGIVSVYLVVTEGFKGLKHGFSLGGIVLFLIISLPWYVAQFMVNGQEFIQQFFIKHHFMRYMGVISGHKGPFYYYIPVLILGLFPWIFFLPAGIMNVFKNFRSPMHYKDVGTFSDNLGLFACIWFVFIFMFFSLSTTKLPNYILPAIPALSILISGGMFANEGFFVNKKMQRMIAGWKRYSNILIACFAGTAGVAILVSEDYLSKAGFSDFGLLYGSAVVMLALAILNIYALFSKKRLYEYTAICIVAFLFLCSIKAIPIANQYLQGTLHKYSLYAKNRLSGDERIVAYKINNPSIVFYSCHKIINVEHKEDLSPLTGNGGEILAIIKTTDINDLKECGFNLLEKDEKYALLERK